jgi:hypothetical protein
MQELFIEIDLNGKATVEVKGVKGRRCLDLTQDLEKALGGKVLSRTPTAEMDQITGQTAVTQANKLGG